MIARLDATGALVRTYPVPEPSFWAGLGDGTFWAANYETSNVYRFDLSTGSVLSGFNAGTAAHTVVGGQGQEVRRSPLDERVEASRDVRALG